MRNISHEYGRAFRRHWAGTTLGLLAMLSMPLAGAQPDTGIRAWVNFEQQGEAIIIQGFARASTPVKARYSLRVDAIGDGGRSRSRSASHLRLGPQEASLGRIAIDHSQNGRLEVELTIEAMDGQRLQIREFYPKPGTWAGHHNRAAGMVRS